MKNLFLFFILIGITCCPVFAQKTLVKVTPTEKVTTANDKFLEGDYVNFKVVGTDEIVRGLIVRYQENGFAGKSAILVLDQFCAVNHDAKYEGTIAINGNEHNGIMEFFADFALYVRGGEVTILPNKDVFELWRIE